jgi:hypothetical protein
MNPGTDDSGRGLHTPNRTVARRQTSLRCPRCGNSLPASCAQAHAQLQSLPLPAAVQCSHSTCLCAAERAKLQQPALQPRPFQRSCLAPAAPFMAPVVLARFGTVVRLSATREIILIKTSRRRCWSTSAVRARGSAAVSDRRIVRLVASPGPRLDAEHRPSPSTLRRGPRRSGALLSPCRPAPCPAVPRPSGVNTPRLRPPPFAGYRRHSVRPQLAVLRQAASHRHYHSLPQLFEF